MNPTRDQDEIILRCLEYFDAGWNYNEIGKILGKNRGFVRRVIRKVLKEERDND